jgi:signal transduction histidine kinase
VRALAAAHGGSVSAGDREQGGARFTVRLPTVHQT